VRLIAMSDFGPSHLFLFGTKGRSGGAPGYSLPIVCVCSRGVACYEIWPAYTPIRPDHPCRKIPPQAEPLTRSGTIHNSTRCGVSGGVYTLGEQGCSNNSITPKT
jgi:hypothetical protein